MPEPEPYNELNLKYSCYIQHSHEHRNSSNFSKIKFSQKQWDTYKMYNLTLINDFVDDARECVYDDYIQYVFTKKEYEHYSMGYSLLTPAVKVVHRQAKQKQQQPHFYTMQITDTTYYNFNTHKCRYFHGKTEYSVVNSFILQYMIYLNAYNELLLEIKKSDLSIEQYEKMFNLYNSSIPKTVHSVVNDDYYDIGEICVRCNLLTQHCKCVRYQYSVSERTFSKKANQTFALLNKNYTKDLEKQLIVLSNSSIDCDKLLNERGIGEYEIVSRYDDFVLWENNGTDSINVITLYALVNYRDINNNIIELSRTVNRGLIIPFLISCNPNAYKVMFDMKENPYAIPIFKLDNIPNSKAIMFFKEIIENPPVFNKNNTCVYRCMCKELNNDIKQQLEHLPTEEDIIKLFTDDNDIPKPKKSKKKKPNKKPSAVVAIDISDTTNNEVIELPNIEIKEPDDEPDDEPDEPNIIQPIPNNINVVVKYNKLPFAIMFYRYEYIAYNEQDLINLMITQLYLTNNAFKMFMLNYNSIRVIQGIHTDFSGLDKSLHFNIMFYNTKLITKTKPHHAYINANNEIISITTIVNILIN